MVTLKERINAFRKPEILKKKTLENLADYAPPVFKVAQAFAGSIKRTPYRTLYQLYRMDGFMFGVIQRYAHSLTKGEFIIEGGREDWRKEIQAWYNTHQSTFIPNLTDQIVELCIGGTGLGEYALNSKGNDINHIIVIPFNYVRLKTDIYGNVPVDEDGNPIGFFYLSPASGQEIPLQRRDVLILKLFGPESDFLGQSPLETVYKPSLIRMNIEEAVGQSIFRHGFPVFVMKIGDEEHEVTAEQAKLLAKDLKKMGERDEWVIPYWWNLEIKEGQQLTGVEAHMEYFSSISLAPFMMPKPLLFAGQVGRVGGAFNTLIQEYQEHISVMQGRICRQLENQLFPSILVTRGIMEEDQDYDEADIPTCKWRQHIELHKLNQARRISALAKVGLITRDDKLENYLRELEDLPPFVAGAPGTVPPDTGDDTTTRTPGKPNKTKGFQGGDNSGISEKPDSQGL